ncbi:MAG: SusD/RagB family nutrient-binding outer membrane lipoprotein [Pseudoflavonifractor sp.]|nr:SusD/RagB family nutrient-binding outer membrane lipoprotein [Pseudoflavonifractor sp.]
MKKYLIIPLAAFALVSCTEDVMDDINKDNGNPPIEVIDGKLMITDAITSTAYTTTSGDYSFYTSVLNEQLFGCGNNQFKELEMRNTSETAGSSTFNNVWNGTYANLLNLNNIMTKCADGGLNAGQHDLLGMAQLLSAINWGILTDMHGDIPCSQAIQGSETKQPVIDPQKDVYTKIMNLIDNAINNLQTAIDNGESHVGAQDLLYNGDASKWLAAAYAVKARYKLHLSFRDAAALDDAATAAQKAIDLGFSGCDFDRFDGKSNSMNPWAAFQYSRDYIGNSASLHNKMADRNDPRCDVYFRHYDASETGPVTYGINGNLADAQKTYEIGAPGWLEYQANGAPAGIAASIHILSLSEVYFILAEVKARKGTDYTSDLTNAIEASFDDTRSFGTVTGTAADYVASLSSRLADNAVKEVMIQKYISQVRDENVEAYNDIRRCKAMGETFVAFENPRDTQQGVNYWPLRLPYGNSDVSANPNVAKAYGDGKYVFTENIWIFGGNR